MTMQNKKTPAWFVERAAQAELNANEVEELRQRLAAEGRSMDEELGSLRESNHQILADLPRNTMGAAIRRRAERTQPEAGRSPRSRMVMLLAPTLLAGSIAAALFVVRGPGKDTLAVGKAGSTEEEVTAKGDVFRAPRLVVYRRKAAQAAGLPGSERLTDGARAARGDVLQLAYDKAPDGLYGVMLSIDGAGRVTQHMPDEGARTAAPLVAVREIPLPSAYELDDAPDFERFVLVASHEPFSVDLALDTARALARQGRSAEHGALALGPNYLQTSVVVHKTGKGAP
jgi:hypothetical protein